MSREEEEPTFQTYLNRHINDAKRDDDNDEDGSGQADHDQGADDAQEAQDPARKDMGGYHPLWRYPRDTGGETVCS